VVIDNIVLFNRTPDELYNRVFVVSAFSGVTNLLLENKKTKEPGVYHRIAADQDFHQSLTELLTRLKEINQKYESLGLDLAAADSFIEKHIASAQIYLENLAGILASGYVNAEGILQAAREILASIGETHSAFNLANILQWKGINALFIDLGGFEDKRPLTIDQRIREAF
jgi:aspartate kinase